MAAEDAYERFVAPINLHGAKLRPVFVESERIAATIHKVAEDEKVDLKVISTRGRSRSAVILLGSVTEGVIVLTEFIVPATDTPGAKAAKYIDLMLHDVASEDRGWIRELIRKTSKLIVRKKGYDKERLRHRWAPCCRARPQYGHLHVAIAAVWRAEPASPST